MLIFQEKVIRHVWFDYYDRVIDIIIRFECAYCSSWVSWCLAPFFAEYLTSPTSVLLLSSDGQSGGGV